MANDGILLQDVDGEEIITNALIQLVNQYPALESGDNIRFGWLNADYGKAVFPVSGTVIEREIRDILGRTKQYCQYPLYVIYRCGGLTENRKKNVKEWLDNLGRWLEQQPIKIGDTVYTLTEYPTLTGTRKFTRITRTSPASLIAENENNTEDWAISLTARYTNDF